MEERADAGFTNAIYIPTKDLRAERDLLVEVVVELRKFSQKKRPVKR